MDCSGAVYARFPEGGIPALEEAIRAARSVSKHFSPLKVLGGDPAKHAFAVVDRWGRTDNIPVWVEGPDLEGAKELAELSRLVGDVVAFYLIDEGLTVGIYGAWKDGRLVRNLQWGDFQWLVADGEPQPWEAPLFTPEALEDNLECARYDGQEEAEVRAVFAAGRITASAAFPSPKNLARHLLAACPGPLYGFEPWPPRSTLVNELNPPRK